MEKTLGSIFSRDTRWALAGLVGFGALIRLILFFEYPPFSDFADTEAFIVLARQIASLDLSQYDGGSSGGRTPIYPLLILLGGMNAHGVFFLQALLGIVASVLLFLTALSFKRNYTLAILVGLAPTVFLNQLFMEACVMSEHIAGVLAVASLYVGVTILMRGGGTGRTVVLGLLVAATVLARPGYIALVPVYAVAAFLQAQQARFARTGIYLAAACLPIAGWMAIMAATVGIFTISPRTGVHLMNHSGAFIEYADPRYATIRDVYLHHRSLKKDRGKNVVTVLDYLETVSWSGGNINVIFEAADDLKAATGLSAVELSRELQKLSLDLFWRYPDLYAKSVFKAWLSYWTATIVWEPDALRSPLASALVAVWRVERPLIWLANLTLLLAVTGLLLRVAASAVRGRFSAIVEDRRLLALLLVGGSVFWFAIFQALVEYGENGRYSIPTQQMVVAFVAFYVSWLIDQRRAVR